MFQSVSEKSEQRFYIFSEEKQYTNPTSNVIELFAILYSRSGCLWNNRSAVQFKPFVCKKLKKQRLFQQQQKGIQIQESLSKIFRTSAGSWI